MPDYVPTNSKIIAVSDITADNFRPFNNVSQDTVRLLESISAADKAQAVPYLLMWQIDPQSGRPMRSNTAGRPSRPLSMMFTQPPSFGAQIVDPDFRFRERPPVSIDTISIKSQNPRGLILYRTIDITLTVHRPDVLFQDPEKSLDGDVWSSLVTPNCMHAMEYGWSASPSVKNGIINGDGVNEPLYSVPGRQLITFVVTSYTFSIASDNQIKFQIKAFESGEYRMRQAFLGGETQLSTSQEAALKRTGRLPTNVAQDVQKRDQEKLKAMMSKVREMASLSSKNKKAKSRTVNFGQFFEKILYPIVADVYQRVGIELDSVILGAFNQRCGKPIDKYCAGANLSGKSISDFILPLEDVERELQSLMNIGERITMYNVLTRFTNIMNDPVIWERVDDIDPASKTTPDINVKSVITRERGDRNRLSVKFQIFDATREYVKFSSSDNDKLAVGAPRQQIRRRIESKGIPYISLGRGNSFVRDVEFGVVQDEQMQSLFINRAFGQDDSSGLTKDDITSKTSAERKAKAPIAQQIYSPTITGTITMLGNFVFDTFGLIWIDFGVSRWDGPFNVQEREDTINRQGFVTKIKVYSAGTDPLGTQGR